MRRANRGLLFGPREAGCWEFLLAQAWSCFLLAAAIGWFTGSLVAWRVASSFFAEGTLLVLLLVSVAQLCWVEERFPRIPGICLQLTGLMVPGFVLFTFAHALSSIPLLALLAFACLAIYGGLLLLSILVRLSLALWDRLRVR